MSWKENLLEDFEGIRRRVERTSSQISLMYDNLLKRVASEKMYAASCLNVTVPPGDVYPLVVSCNFAISGFAGQRAKNSLRFVEGVEREVLPALAALKEVENEVLAPLLTEGTKTMLSLQKEYRNHDDAVIGYDAACRVADNAIASISDSQSSVGTTAPTSSVRKRMRAAEACRLANERADDYARAVASVNSRRKEVVLTLDPLIDSLQQTETSRLIELKSIVGKLLVFEMEEIKNNEFDLKQVIKSISDEGNSDIFVESEIADFSKRRGRAPGRQGLEGATPVLTWKKLQITMPAGISKNQSDGVDRSLCVEIYNSLARFFAPNRPIDAIISVSADELDSLVPIFQKAFDSAQAGDGYEAARLVWALAPKIFVDESPRRALIVSIYNHPILNQSVFWEEMLSGIICEEFIYSHRERGNLETSEKNFLLFAQVDWAAVPALAEEWGLGVEGLLQLALKVEISHKELLVGERGDKFKKIFCPGGLNVLAEQRPGGVLNVQAEQRTPPISSEEMVHASIPKVGKPKSIPKPPPPPPELGLNSE